jgi:plasmid maintenance system antidote protein VapI
MGAKRDRLPDLEDQLRSALRGCGMSLNQLAAATGVHKAQLSRFLRQERTLTLIAAAKLCAHLGLRLVGPASGRSE